MSSAPTPYQRLGFRAFWMFLFMRSGPAFIIAGFCIVLLIVSQAVILPPDLSQFLLPAFALVVMLFFLALFGGFVVALFQYFAYEFALDEHALKIRSGILNIHVEAIPYRQMQNVDIERDFLYRLLGISRLVVLTAASDDTETNNESEAVIPAIDKKLGYHIQEELLRHANVEKVALHSSQSDFLTKTEK